MLAMVRASLLGLFLVTGGCAPKAPWVVTLVEPVEKVKVASDDVRIYRSVLPKADYRTVATARGRGEQGTEFSGDLRRATQSGEQDRGQCRTHQKSMVRSWSYHLSR